MSKDLTNFIKRQIKYHQQKRGVMEENYQETGKSFYYKAMVKHENYVAVLNLALDTECRYDKGLDVFNRQLNALKNSFEMITMLADPSKALNQVQEEVDALKSLFEMITTLADPSEELIQIQEEIDSMYYFRNEHPEHIL